MQVKDLIEQLQTLPPDVEVVLSKDSEGNGFSPYADPCLGYYFADTSWSGDFYDDVSMHDEPDEYPDIDEEKMIRAVCLWPLN